MLAKILEMQQLTVGECVRVLWKYHCENAISIPITLIPIPILSNFSTHIPMSSQLVLLNINSLCMVHKMYIYIIYLFIYFA